MHSLNKAWFTQLVIDNHSVRFEVIQYFETQSKPLKEIVQTKSLRDIQAQNKWLKLSTNC